LRIKIPEIHFQDQKIATAIIRKIMNEIEYSIKNQTEKSNNAQYIYVETVLTKTWLSDHTKTWLSDFTKTWLSDQSLV
jgi:hypothetical protein